MFFVKNLQIISLSVVFSMFSSLVSANDESVKKLLNKMVSSLSQSNYQAYLTHEQQGRLNSLQVNHSVFDGVEYEKIVFLNGKEQALVRSGRTKDCVTLGAYFLQGGTLKSRQGAISSLFSHYYIKIIGRDRVADRSAWLLDISPMQPDRYGYYLSLDEETALPLKLVIKTPQKRYIERFNFVRLDTDIVFDKSSFFDDQNAVKLEADTSVCAGNNSPVKSPSPMRPQWLPSGFVLADQKLTESGVHVETYTDGLGTFSIFVEAMTDQSATAKDDQPFSEAHRGATYILTTTVPRGTHSWNISVVGEIPPSAARQITLSMR